MVAKRSVYFYYLYKYKKYKSELKMLALVT